MQILSGPQINFQTSDMDVYVVARVAGDIVPERNNLRVGDVLPVKISKSGTIDIPCVGSVVNVSFVSIHDDCLEYFR